MSVISTTSTPPATVSSSCPAPTASTTSATRPRASGVSSRMCPMSPLCTITARPASTASSTGSIQKALVVLSTLSTMFSPLAPPWKDRGASGLPSPSMKKFMTDTTLDYDKPPVPLHDCLHWYYGRSMDTESKVLVFDTVDESFRCMRSPIADNVALAHLCQMDGTLGIRQVDHDTMTVQVWALQDYKTEVWSLKHRIPFPVVEMTKYVSDKVFCLIFVSESGDMLVWGHFPWILFQYDSRGNLVDKFQPDSVTPTVLRLSLKESLVRHAFFEREEAARFFPRDMMVSILPIRNQSFCCYIWKHLQKMICFSSHLFKERPENPPSVTPESIAAHVPIDYRKNKESETAAGDRLYDILVFLGCKLKYILVVFFQIMFCWFLECEFYVVSKSRFGFELLVSLKRYALLLLSGCGSSLLGC